MKKKLLRTAVAVLLCAIPVAVYLLWPDDVTLTAQLAAGDYTGTQPAQHAPAVLYGPLDELMRFPVDTAAIPETLPVWRLRATMASDAMASQEANIFQTGICEYCGIPGRGSGSSVFGNEDDEFAGRIRQALDGMYMTVMTSESRGGPRIEYTLTLRHTGGITVSGAAEQP